MGKSEHLNKKNIAKIKRVSLVVQVLKESTSTLILRKSLYSLSHTGMAALDSLVLAFIKYGLDNKNLEQT